MRRSCLRWDSNTPNIKCTRHKHKLARAAVGIPWGFSMHAELINHVPLSRVQKRREINNSQHKP